MNPKSLCMGCMADTNAAAVCLNCGYAYDTPAESFVQLTPRTMLNRKYLLGRVLGQGGFGITYLAYDLETDRKLAIKEYFPSIISTRARDRLTVTPVSSRNREDLEYGLQKFFEEGQALMRFRDHPNVVTMVEFFRANSTGYIVMVYIEGRTFKEHLLSSGGHVSFTEALQPLTLIMNALEDLHRAGILHRDVSPDNIYMENGGGVRILDFGATRYAMGDHSRSLSVVLKPGYAPEEQYRSRGKQGPWTDIYALGATFYRAITGKVPPESMDRQQLDDLAAPSSLGFNIPPRSESALLKALAVKAENRFQSIAEFREGITPQKVAPAHAPATASKFIFVPIFAVLATLVLVSAGDADWRGVSLLSQFLLFCSTLVLLFWMWKPIQDSQTAISPRRAAGLMLIPGFNIYWIFRAFWGFAKEYNKFLERHVLPLRKLNPLLFLLCSMSFVAYWLGELTFNGGIIRLFLIPHACFLFPAVLNIGDRIDALKRTGMEKVPRPMSDLPQKAVPPKTVVRSAFLHCALGEYQGQDIEIAGEIVIGRNPSFANLVLSSGKVSAKHVRVWFDPSSAGIWIEDLNSMNGTYYKESASSESGWSRLQGRKLLSNGDRFRLSSEAAEFEIKAV
jgi:serine/threonine protein kinase